MKATTETVPSPVGRESHLPLSFTHPLASIPPTLEFCRKLDSIVGPQLTVLASDICEQYNINKRISGFVPHVCSCRSPSLVG